MLTVYQKIIVLVGVGLMSFLVAPVQPQEVQYRNPLAQQQRFTVDEAIAYGLINNPGLRSVRFLNDIAQGEVVSAAIMRNSSIALAYSRARTRSGGGGAGHDEGAVALPDEEGHEEEEEHEEEAEEHDESAAESGDSIAKSHSRTFSISQVFDLTGKRPIRLLLARSNLDQVRIIVAEAEIDLVRNIKRACAEYIALTDGMAEVHNVMYTAKPYIWAASVDSPGDRLRAQTAFLNMDQDVKMTRQAVMRSETELSALLGLPADTRFLITGSLDPKPIPLGYKELASVILARNLNIQLIVSELRAARYSLDLAMRDKVPTIDVSYSATRDKAEGSATRTHQFAVGVAVDFFRQVVEQNRGEIMSAKGAINATENALEHARWELENELHALYQDLNLTAVRIRILEEGHLKHLELLVTEQDNDDYEDGKIEMNTWLLDVNQYHMNGETLLALQAAYEASLATLEFLAGGSFDVPVQVPMENPGETMATPNQGYFGRFLTKAGRGLGNIALSPVEVPAAWYGYTQDRGLFGFIAGPFEGGLTTVERSLAGLLDVVTAPVPWPLEKMTPVSQPILGENPWTGSWSLRFIHPAYNYEPVYNYGGATPDEGSR